MRQFKMHMIYVDASGQKHTVPSIQDDPVNGKFDGEKDFVAELKRVRLEAAQVASDEATTALAEKRKATFIPTYYTGVPVQV